MLLRRTPVERSALTTTDPDAAYEFLRRTYVDHDIRARDNPQGCGVAAHGLSCGGLRMDGMRHSRQMAEPLVRERMPDMLAATALATFPRTTTARAVQYAFHRHLDTTPMLHLRRVRLDPAHRCLLAADPRTTTVTEVAARPGPTSWPSTAKPTSTPPPTPWWSTAQG